MATGDLDLEALEKALAAATELPWRGDSSGLYVYGGDSIGSPVADSDIVHSCVARIRGHGAEVGGHRPHGSQAANLALIVAAVNALPRLIRIARGARTVVEARGLDVHYAVGRHLRAAVEGTDG